MLNGQAVRIPTGFSRHVIAAHRFVARERILKAACKHVVNTRLAVCCWWTFIETELRTTFVLVQRFRKRIVLTPELQHLVLERWSVVAACDFLKRQTNLSIQKRPGRINCVRGDS